MTGGEAKEVNSICATCRESCKQGAMVKVVACAYYKRKEKPEKPTPAPAA